MLLQMLDVITGNSSSAVGNSVNSAEDDTLSSDLSSTCPNPTMQRPYGLQCKLDENVIKLANAEKWYSDTLSLDLSSTCPNLMQHPHWLQCKIDEDVTKLANAEKWYVDSSSSIVSNPVDSTEDDTSYLYLLVSTIVGIVCMSYGLDVDIVGPRGCCGL